MRIGVSQLYVLDKNSVFLNNGTQAIELAAGSATVFRDPGTVPALTVPYHFYTGVEIHAKVTFEPGVTCLFDQNLRILVTQSGSLIADGTETQKITFSGLNQSPGSWKGIEIDSPSSENIINYGIVDNGGSTAGRKANIYLYGNSGK